MRLLSGVTLGLRLNGSSLSVEIDGVTRITATDSTFTTGEVGLWSYQPTAANQHLFDDFLVQNLGQGYIPGSKVRAAENRLEKVRRRNGELRKAQLLQAPPAGQVWRSYYFVGSARIAMRVQVNGSNRPGVLPADRSLGSTTVSYRSDGGRRATRNTIPGVSCEGEAIPCRPIGPIQVRGGLSPLDWRSLMPGGLIAR